MNTTDTDATIAQLQKDKAALLAALTDAAKAIDATLDADAHLSSCMCADGAKLDDCDTECQELREALAAARSAILAATGEAE